MLFLGVVDAGPLDVFDEESFEGAVDISDEVDWVEKDGSAADLRGELELFALNHFDGDKHENEIN